MEQNPSCEDEKVESNSFNLPKEDSPNEKEDPLSKIFWQSSLIKTVIILKVLLTLSFLAVCQQKELLFFCLLLSFEICGYIGSSNLNANLNLIFLSILFVSVLARTGDILFFYSVIYEKKNKDKYFKETYGNREDYKSYFFASVILWSVDCWQIYTCIRFISKVSELSEQRLARVKKYLENKYCPYFASQKNILIR